MKTALIITIVIALILLFAVFSNKSATTTTTTTTPPPPPPTYLGFDAVTGDVIIVDSTGTPVLDANGNYTYPPTTTARIRR